MWVYDQREEPNRINDSDHLLGFIYSINKEREKQKKYLNLIPDVDDEGIGDRLNGDPVITSTDLEAGDVLVGEEEGHAAGVRVRGEAQSEVRLWALWVEVCP